MKLEERIETYIEQFSKEFPDLEDIASLYLIVALLHFSPRKSHISDWSFSFLVDRSIVSKIVESRWFDLKYFTNSEIRQASQILMSNCIENAIRFSRMSLNDSDVIHQLYIREPESVSIISEKPTSNKNFGELLSYLRAGNSHVHITSSDGLRYQLHHQNLSRKGFAELAKLEMSIGIDPILKDLRMPQDLYKLLAEVCDTQPNSKIEIPYAGIGSIPIALNKTYPDYNLVTLCNTENSFAEVLFEANLVANDCNINFLGSNDFLEDAEYYLYEGTVDLSVAVLPFKKQIDKKNLSGDLFKDSYNVANAQYASVELMLSSVNNNGKIVAVVSDNFLFSKQGVNFRRNLLLNDRIERIISLPKDILNPYSSIKSSIIVLSKAKSQKGTIVFDGYNDANYQETLVNNDEILSSTQIDLRASRYAVKQVKELRNILMHTQYSVKKIKELISSPPISGKNHPQNLATNDNGSDDKVPFVRVSELSKIGEDFNLSISKIERRISRERVPQKQLIDFNVVLVNLIGNKLKPTYFKFEGTPIVVGSDIISLKMNEDINIEYFFTQLRSRLVQIQVEMSSSGTTINRISKEDFLDIQIILPSFEEQQRQVLEMRGIIEEKAIAQEQLSLAKREIETTEYDVIAAISHNLNQKLGKIVDDYGTLVMFLQKKEEKNSTFRFDELLRPVRAGELVESVPTFSKVVTRLQNNLLDTAETMKTTEKILQKSKVDAEETDIIEFFRKSIKPDFESSRFSIKIESRLKSLIALVDRNAFKDAIRNLIENAKNHGFLDSDRKYQIVFEISRYTNELGEDFARIVYKNDGKPFPKDYKFEDYVRLGTRAGKNKGTGLGGFFVKKVIELHKGKFSPITLHENGFEIFPVQMEILMPLAD